MAGSPLYALHRLLISFAIALGGLLLVYGIARFVQFGDKAALGIGLGGAVAASLLSVYLRWFLRSKSP